MGATASVRRLRRGDVSAELDYDASHVILSCRRHGVDEHVPFTDDDVGSMLIHFFERHHRCSRGAQFEVEDRMLAPH